MNNKMNIRINVNELYLRKLVKSAGGRWNSEKRVWELPYKEVLASGLEKQIINEDI